MDPDEIQDIAQAVFETLQEAGGDCIANLMALRTLVCAHLLAIAEDDEELALEGVDAFASSSRVYVRALVANNATVN